MTSGIGAERRVMRQGRWIGYTGQHMPRIRAGHCLWMQTHKRKGRTLLVKQPHDALWKMGEFNQKERGMKKQRKKGLWNELGICWRHVNFFGGI
jgi:hypothetical protein